MTIGNQASDDIDKAVDWTAMARVFNLRNIFELVNNTLDDGSLTQE